MAYREVLRMEVAEVVRRWQAGNSQRNIASGTGLSRDTVRKYLAAAKEAGVVQEGPAPTEDQLSRLAGISRSGLRQSEAPSEELLGPWADQVYRWLNVERLQLTRIQELLAARGCQVAYSSLHRFVARRNWRGRSRSTVRMEDTAPGEVAELDFGRLGLIQDPETGRRRTAWTLIVVLAYFRHSFVWPTFSQKLEDVIAGLEAAWAFFGGVPRYLVIDNFPAAVAGADALHPRLTRGFLEYSQHRGFITDPARVRHPKDKPHVERGVQYVRERFFRGSNFASLEEMRLAARRWCLDVAGLRVHGTTRRRPLQVFQDEEHQVLASWDGEPHEITHWRTAKVHPDHHVACQYALYSVPSSLCPPGQRVEIGLGSKLVRNASFLEIILSDEVNRRADRRIELRLQGGLRGDLPPGRLRLVGRHQPGTAAYWTPSFPWSSWPSTSTYCWWDRRVSARASWPRPWASPPSGPGTPSASSTLTTSSGPWPRPEWTTRWTAPSGPSWPRTCSSLTIWSSTGSPPSSRQTSTS